MKFKTGSEALVDKTLAKVALLGAKESFEKGGYPALADKLFEELGVQPIYLAEQRPEFTQWREKLRTESGLVISNHPGAIDIPSILKTLDRKDVYFIVAEKNVERVKGVIDEDHLFPAVQDIGQLRAVLRRVEEALNAGSVVFLFPTGGLERVGKLFKFKSGFGYILKFLKPEQMVYTFQVSPEDVEHIFPGSSRGLQMGSALITGKIGLPKQKDSLKTVRVDERYTVAETWQHRLKNSSSSKTDRNERLTEHYLNLFKEEKGE